MLYSSSYTLGALNSNQQGGPLIKTINAKPKINFKALHTTTYIIDYLQDKIQMSAI